MKNFLIISLLLVTGNTLAQGIESELYQYNYGFVHPAFAGSEGQRISMLARTSTYDGSFGDQKETMLLMTYENYFEKLNSGIAVTGHAERLGATSLSSVALSYNYKFPIGTASQLIAGARIQRNFTAVSYDFFRPIEPSDPIIGAGGSSMSNWGADLGVLLKVNKFYAGLSTNDLIRTGNPNDAFGAPMKFEAEYNIIVGTTLTISENLASQHSLYIPFGADDLRLDLNNTLIINDLLLAGLSLERSNDQFFVRGNAGVKVKDYFQIMFLLYSGKRYEFFAPKFRGEVFMTFQF